MKSESSYDQYHWCPIDFTETRGLFTSSRRYSSRRDGRAIKIKVTAGNTVHTSSIVCPSSRYRFTYLFGKRVTMMYLTRIVIITRINMV